jgi:protein ImuB
MARFGRDDVAIVEDEPLVLGAASPFSLALQPLPVRALVLDDLSLQGLAEVNIRTVGELLALPRAAVAGRFGEPVLHALDGATGRAGLGRETIEPIRPREPIQVEQVFDGPCVMLEGIGLACRDLLERFCVLLSERDQGVTDWVATFQRSDLAPVALVFRHCGPSREPRHLWRLLQPRLERVHLGFGVEGVSMTARGVKGMHHEQQTLWNGAVDSEESPHAAADLIDALVNRLGKDAVLRAELVASYVPERAFVMRSVLDGAPSSAAAASCLPADQGDRPTRLFVPAFLASVIALHPEGPVSRIEWGGGGMGRVHRIVSCIGPERIKSEWWQSERFARDYFKVRDEEGLWLWVYRDVPGGGWFVQGVWR